MKRPYLFVVSGRKNTGKSKLICALLEELVRRGYKAATIKHDGHDFDPDREGTDTYAHYQAGAYGTAIYSDTKFMLVKRQKMTAEMLAEYFPEADVIIVEGLKGTEYPKFETVRDYTETICNPVNLKAVIASEENKEILSQISEVPVYNYSNIETLCDIIEEGMMKKQNA